MTDRIAASTELLLAARSTGKTLKAFPAGTGPQDRGEAYAIQRAVVAKLGVPIAGYKISVMPDGSTMVLALEAAPNDEPQPPLDPPGVLKTGE